MFLLVLNDCDRGFLAVCEPYCFYWFLFGVVCIVGVWKSLLGASRSC